MNICYINEEIKQEIKQEMKDSESAWSMDQGTGGVEELLKSGYKRMSQMDKIEIVEGLQILL